MTFLYFAGKTRFFCFLFGVGVGICRANGQDKIYSVANTHAHNDYEHPIPFWTAYYAGFGSIEADVALRHNQLFVTHDTLNTTPGKTLRSLYLEPLREVIQNNGGYVYKDSAKKLLLLIDLKTTAEPTLEKVIEELQAYKDITGSATLEIVITGNQPDVSRLTAYPPYINFDGNFKKTYTAEALEKVILFSDNFSSYTKWNGKGIPVESDRIKLGNAVTKAHSLKKPMRFWAAPDGPNAWYQLMNLNVDYINTDKIQDLSTFLNKLAATSYTSSNATPVYKPTFKQDKKDEPVKNVILLIGDGMGLAHIYAAYTANHGALNMLNMRSTGMSKTDAADSYITDSGGSGTAMATGKKTNNRHIGVDDKGVALPQLPAVFKSKRKSTGVITTGDVADATPAAFYARNNERDSLYAIASDFITSSVDLLIGSGRKNFARSSDSLLKALRSKSVDIHFSVEEKLKEASKTLVLDEKAGLTFLAGRGDFLAKAMQKSLSFLAANKHGFFLMAEGAKIDAGGHLNNLATVVTELLDFDAAVGTAMQWADNHPGTLVIVTADHETGGLTLMDGNIKRGYVSGHFSTEDHTAISVPVFAYGPRSGAFAGFYNNTEIYHKIVEVLR